MVGRLSLVTYDLDSLRIGSLLGTGGFSSVYCIGGEAGGRGVGTTSRKIRSSKDEETLASFVDEDDDDDDKADPHGNNNFEGASSTSFAPLTSTSTISSVFSLPLASSGEMAVKMLHTQTLECQRRAKIAVHDIENEVKILSRLPRHRNIVAIYGVSSKFGASPKQTFFVMERLGRTVEDMIKQWRTQESRNGFSLFRFLLFARNHSKRQSQARRIQKVALDVASALSFLRKQRVIFRDIKPSNMALDASGTTVKLLDFGLARKLPNDKPYQLARNGTVRYMAPEVARNEPYTFSADVYSFGLVLWELCCLERPFARVVDRVELDALAVQSDRRPPLGRVASPIIRNLLKRCWTSNPTSRPLPDGILSDLRLEMKSLSPRRMGTFK